MIAYTLPQVRRLLAELVLTACRTAEHTWNWSA